MTCPVCLSSDAEVHGPATRLCHEISCRRCGNFKLDLSTYQGFNNTPSGFPRWKISAWLRQNQPEMLTQSLLGQAIESTPPSLTQRCRRILKELGEFTSIGSRTSLSIPQRQELMSLSWCKDENELQFLLKDFMTNELEWIKLLSNGLSSSHPDIALTAKGALELETNPSAESHIGFCAMWFSTELLPLFLEVIEPAIRDAGYEPLRLDYKEYNHSIDDEIIASIRGSRFVIADLTGHRGGVYYEAGFARGLGLPIIFMHCEDDAQEVHFDVRQQNFICWQIDQFPDARKRLTNRIRATIGQGPLNLHHR